MISNSISPAGTLTVTLSPIFFPTRACAMGVLMASLPSLKLASVSGTRVYAIVAFVLVFLIVTLYIICTLEVSILDT